MADEFIGKTIGGYEIEAKIGQGGMATVYRARQTSMNRSVALKILPRHFMRDDTYIQRFEREVRIVAQLEHRNIVPVYDYGEHDDQPFIAMRYMSGGTVDDMLQHGALSPETIVSIMRQVGPALDYAHSKNVLHRDLKPSNILMDDDGGAYITDFGIARITGAESKGPTITTQGVVGTPSYMSPEQAQGQDLDGRSDIYALGVMLFEMATGRRPFENETPYSIAVMQVTTPPPFPRNINPTISTAIERVILKVLKKNRDERYSTALDLAEAVQRAVEKPDSVHDTQPRPIPVQNHSEMTQQTPASNPNNRQQIPSSSASSNPVPAPPPSSGNMYPPAPHTSQNISRPYSSINLGRPVRGKRKKGNMWVGIAIGGLLGCALLSAIIVGGAYVVSNFINNDPSEAELAQTAEATDEIGAFVIQTEDFEPLDLTSAAARNELLSATETADTTLSPLGVRETGTPLPTYDPEEGVIVFFDEREYEQRDETVRNTDIYSYNLRTNFEFRLTTSSVGDSYPVALPDGERIVFQSSRDGDFEIFVMNANGSGLEQLTFNTTLDRLAAWSPDGEWIIYSSDTFDDGNYDLYRIRADGGGVPVLVYSNGKRNSHPRYSPDGAYVVFTTGLSDDANTWDVAVLNVETGEVTLLTDNDVRDASPTFSADGTSILYIIDTDDGQAIATIPADGSGEEGIIFQDSGNIWGAYYSPDGAHIVFNVEVAGDSVMYYMTADGGEVIRIRNEGGTGFSPSWIP